MIKSFLLIALCFFYSLGLSAQTIQLTTEHYPPYNIDLTLEGKEGVGGASTEIVLEMMRRSGYSYALDLMSWQRAYGAAQENPYTGVFSTARTEKREELFKWVGPIANNNYVLLVNAHSDIKINNDDDLHRITIGAYRGGAAENLLKAIDVDSDLVRSDHLNTLKLQRNRIDAWLTGNLYGPYLAKQYGVTGLKEIYTVRKAQMYVAFNINTPQKVIDKLNNILKEMRKEGFFEKVNESYR